MGPDAIILVFLMLSCKPVFSLFFTLIKRLFSSSSFSAIKMVSSAYLRLLIFLLAVLILACASSSPAFLFMYSAYINKQGDNIQPWCTPFPIWNQSVVSCQVLTVASWPAYRFLKRQVKKEQLELDMKQQTGSKLGMEYMKAVYCHHAYFNNLYAKYIIQNASTSWNQDQ